MSNPRWKLEEVVEEVEDRLEREERETNESARYGHNSPGFNQNLGRSDALRELLAWLKGEE